MPNTSPNNVIDLRGVRTKAMEYQVALKARLREERTPVLIPLAPPREGLKKPRVEGGVRVPVIPFLRIALIAWLIAGGYNIQPWVASSLAYFSDTEAAPANAVASSILDISAGEDGAEDIMCGGSASFPVSVELVSTRASSYEVQALYKEGDIAFCELLDVSAELNGSPEYEGDLIGGAGLYVGGLTATGTWDFDISLGAEGVSIPDGTVCSVDIIFRAWCPLLGAYGSGFHDEDRVTLTLTKNGCTGGQCEECPGGGCGDVIIDVENNNEADVENVIVIEQNTGGNSANGGAGGDGGESGASGEGASGSTGQGGNGGDAGSIKTGNSSVNISISQTINSNSTNITTTCSGCRTPECSDGKLEKKETRNNEEAVERGRETTKLLAPDAQALLQSIQNSMQKGLGR